MGKPFEIVLQRVQGTGSVLSFERSLDQSICKSRIFGQDRAMAVGTESIFVPHTFGPVLSVISITFDDFPQRADTCSQKGAPAVNSAVTPDSRLAPEQSEEVEPGASRRDLCKNKFCKQQRKHQNHDRPDDPGTLFDCKGCSQVGSGNVEDCRGCRKAPEHRA